MIMQFSIDAIIIIIFVQSDFDLNLFAVEKFHCDLQIATPNRANQSFNDIQMCCIEIQNTYLFIYFDQHSYYRITITTLLLLLLL